MTATPVQTTIAPWLAVSDGAKALAHYRDALGAVVIDRLDDGDRVLVAQLHIDGAPFWLQEDPDNSPNPRGPRPARMILIVDDPDARFARALAAGATEIAAIRDAHGWRTGRVRDPFGHDWEFSKPLSR